MRTLRNWRNWTAALIGVSGLGFAGCGDVSGLAQNAVTTPATSVLGEISAADAAAGFNEFASKILGDEGVGAVVPLDDEQLAAIEDAQAALTAGEITPTEFGNEVRATLGDVAPREAFIGYEFFGGPFGHRFGHRIANYLDLTDAQIQAARDIFQDAHNQIDTLRETLIADIRSALTDEQLEALDNGIAEIRTRIQDRLEDRPHPNRPPPPRIVGRVVRRAWQRLIESLDLTDAQQTAIDALRVQFRTDVQAIHTAARDAFLALLTEEQLQLIEDWRTNHANAGDRTADDSVAEPVGDEE